MVIALASPAPAAVVAAQAVVLMTNRQIKLGAILGLAGLALMVALYLLYRRLARPPDSPAAPARTPDPPAERHVDQAVANVLAHASAQADDTRTVADLVDGAVRIVTDLGGVSVPALQRKLEIDFAKATEVVARLEAAGFVSAPAANGRRKVLAAAYEHVARPGTAPGEP